MPIIIKPNNKIDIYLLKPNLITNYAQSFLHMFSTRLFFYQKVINTIFQGHLN